MTPFNYDEDEHQAVPPMRPMNRVTTPETTTGRQTMRPEMQEPTGRPTGPAPTGQTPVPPTSQQRMPLTPPGEQPPTVMDGTNYTPGYLKTQIGKMMRVEFLVGSSGPLVDRIGTLLSVGVSYILIQPIGSNDVLLCDIYSIKFVTVYSNPLELRRPI